MTRFLIINADDFGHSPAVNQAILRAHTQGVLTSASLMVAEPGFEQAVEMARATPGLGVGLHVALSNDRSLLGHAALPTITTPDGKFRAELFGVSLQYAFSKRAQAEIRREMSAQFARFAATGLPWSHVDGHQHLHIHYFVWNVLLELCDEWGVHRIRIPHEELGTHHRVGGDGPNLNTVASLALNALRRRNLRVLEKRGKLGGKTPFLCDRVYGQLQTGNMNAAYTRQLLTRLTGRTNEIYFHPGSAHSHPLPASEQRDSVDDVELAALLNPEVIRAVCSEQFVLGNYAQIEAATRQHAGFPV